MLSKLKGMKDGAIALFLKSFVNERLSKFGEVQECQVDTANSRVQLRVMLKGEKEPIDLAVERYELERVGDERFIRLKSFSCTREWIGVALNHRLADKQFKLPAAVAGLL
ncbi:MAG: hypothetical protein JWQ90_1388 [Hydrocarboniphaga sp.]|uniref:hypothetical protein n=1 Tax=Hydrocarboniphaga sp. TaxID=2033016 RepID=UPI00262A1567|nr:hypothetical protein [Hydrocarboniphaga sp.]MDB5968938.1 hypothetical protein [Hydrocarboniphaga sp.]